MRDGYPPPPFGPVIPGVFIYAAWRVDPARVGPFLRVSTARAKASTDYGRWLAAWPHAQKSWA
ncbi:hypothetical protein BN970_04187 [Mycolicibacterium conceptionense]|uniref:Uncharacterized protein n=1 Tax=Mycolicibacterium conceptionense TaxID=451644 RepID=A0A0U1DLK6_9MYCO|nr:hypothetical protein BN970_04187 [Mycolicibacterium conceptionense]